MPVIYLKPKWPDFNILQTGDWHKGTLACSDSKIKDTVDMIASDPRTYWVHTGDGAESKFVDNKHYEPELHGKSTADKQVDELAHIAEPAKEQLIAWLLGNHEFRVRHITNITWRVCKELGRPEAYGAWTTIINVLDPHDNVTSTLFFTHAPQRRARLSSTAGDAGQQQANLEASLKKLLAPLHNAHYMGCGHFHRVILRKPAKQLYLETKGKKISQEYSEPAESGYIHPDMRWYGCNGGFYRQYMMSEEFPNDGSGELEPITYSEFAGYEPTEMGNINLSFKDYKLQGCEKVIL